MLQSDVVRLSRALRRISLSAQRRLEQAWPELSNGNRSISKTIDYYPALAEQYGVASSAYAAHAYDDMREKYGVAGDYVATTAPPISPDRAAERVRSSMIPHLDAGDWLSALAALKLSLDKYIKEPARNSLIHNSERDRVEWVRVPLGKTCGYCLIAAYKKHYGEIRKFHGNCDCQIMPLFDGRKPSGYDPDGFEERFQQAVNAVGDGDLNKLVYELDKPE